MDKHEKTFLDLVSRMPPTWTCCKCGDIHDNTPDGEHPAAYQTGIRKTSDGFMKRYVVGDICAKCVSK